MTRGVLAFVPGDAEEVLDARAWLAWLELWRSDESLTTALSGVRLEERALLAEALDYRADTDDLDALGALIDGLLTAVCVPGDPMPIARAADILQRHLPDLATSTRSAEQRADELRNRQRRWRERAAA
jgi:hypothetical protein